MTNPYTASQLEILALEACEHFSWASSERDPNPEGIAFFVDTLIIGGHSRTCSGKTAVCEALDYLTNQFGGTVNGHAPVPSRVVISTQVDEATGLPREPSEDLKTRLREKAGHPVLVTLIGSGGQQSRDLLIS